VESGATTWCSSGGVDVASGQRDVRHLTDRSKNIVSEMAVTTKKEIKLRVFSQSQ
jgi:hypothetical protein